MTYIISSDSWTGGGAELSGKLDISLKMVQEESREAVRRQILSRTRIQVLKTVVFFDLAVWNAL